jgi:hypothetical protein
VAFASELCKINGILRRNWKKIYGRTAMVLGEI